MATNPTVPYRLTLTTGQELTVEHAGDFPAPPALPPREVREPLVTATVVLPRQLTVQVQQLCMERRGEELAVPRCGDHTYDQLIIEEYIHIELGILYANSQI